MRTFATAVLFMFVVGSGVLLTGCGTVSKLQPGQAAGRADMRKYSRVIVQDLGETVSSKAKPEDQARRAAEGKAAARRFAERIASELRISGAFQEVLREGNPSPETLTVGGTVSRLTEGNKAARLLVGLGAGSSYFDATVEVRDASSGDLIGKIVVDKNSWGGGGFLAMDQTVDTFMDEAARKVAKELSAAKHQGVFPPAATGK